MILLDQELKPNPAPAVAARSALPARLASHRQLSLPSPRSLAQFLRRAQTAARLRGRVTVLLATDKAIRRLNRRFRGIDKTTDVLSFPADRAAFPGIAGDIAISVPKARTQAVELDHSLAEEVKILILHGLLHLAGYDHETDGGKMARRERLLRRRLGLPAGLIERSDSNAGATPAPAGRRNGGSGLIASRSGP